MLNDLDLSKIPPSQGGGAHPVGMFDFTLTNTYLKENKDKTGAYLAIEFTSPAGRIEKIYNVINPSPQAVEIANKELSALGHAINIFSVAFPKQADGTPVMNMAGHNMRGGKGRMEVAFQKGHEPTAEKPSGGYVEVRKVFDVNGNEPSKAPTQTAAPMQAQPGGGWGNGAAAQQQPQQAAAQPAWGTPQQQPAQQNVNPAPPPQGGKPSWA